MKSIKILLSYHKPDILFKTGILEPIHVGRKLFFEKNKNTEENNNLNFMLNNMIGDDTGDNISEKNASYNEMTSVYWAWKNYEEIGNPDYIGFMHYRRHFIFKEELEKAYYECNEVLPDHIDKTINCSNELLLNVLETNDFIATKPYYKSSVYDHYKINHKIEDLDLAVKILKEKHPEFCTSCDKYLYSHDTYFCNMFVFPKEIFFKYCDWIFSILFEYEKLTDITGKRLFISERLTGIFIQYLLDQGYKGKFYPTLYIEENVTVPIAMATDSGYLLPTAIAITSILENAKKSTFYDFYLLVNHKIANYSNKYFLPIKAKYSNCKINIVDMNDVFSDQKMNIKHITYQTYYRLYLPSILKKYNKCLYLDSDIIVNGDLTNLYRTNIDEYLIAGVKAAGYFYPERKVEGYLKSVGLESINQYINAGVLLMNLKKMRDRNLEPKFVDLAAKGYPSQDQDILNIVCYNEIRILPLACNLMTKYFSNRNNAEVPDACANFVFSKEEIVQALTSPLIVHFADKIKPWGLYNGIKLPLWKKYEAICPVITERQETKITIIIPVYNIGKFIKPCLDSIQNQILKNMEILCINDGSTDNSLQIIEDYALRDNRILILSHPNSGVAYTRNRGLSIAKSRFVAFMDPDDYYPSNNVLSTLYDKANKHNARICGGSWSENIDNKIKVEFKGVYEKYTFKKEGFIRYKDYQFDFGYHRFIYDLAMLRDGGVVFPLYSRFQDPPFFIKAMIAAKTFYAVKMPTYCYRIGHQNATWKDEKMRDMLLGLIDDLRISSREELGKLHYLTYWRINNENSTKIINHIKNTKNLYLYELLIRANSCLNTKLIKKEDSKLNDNIILTPLRELSRFYHNYYYDTKDELYQLRREIDNIRKSRSYKIGRFVTAPYRLARGFFKCLKENGFKYTMKRVTNKLKNGLFI